VNAAGLVENDYQQYEGQDFEMYFIVSQDQFFFPAGADRCLILRNALGLTMPVLIDPQEVITNQMGIPANTKYIVMGEGNEIVFRGPNPQDMHNAIQDLLAE
jgi:hypothetical protein